MKTTQILAVILVISLMFLFGAERGTAQEAGPSDPEAALGTGFTYQGQISKNGSPITDTCDLQFSLWNALSSGTEVGLPSTVTGVSVSRGSFSTLVNSNGAFGASAFNGEARWLQVGVKCSGDTAYTTLTPRQALTAAPYALALPGFYTRQNATSPNVIGGYIGNSVTGGLYGATISGGGQSAHINSVTASYGTVSGGVSNTASGGGATVGGGESNTASGSAASVGGGFSNSAGGSDATVGGGSSNIASGQGASVGGGGSNTAGNYATVGGGNSNGASSNYATVSGGLSNTASGAGATVGGGDNNTASGSAASVGGGFSNSAGGSDATVGGGSSNIASGQGASVGGGGSNTASGGYSTVPGGNSNTAQGNYSFAAGYRATAGQDGTFVWADYTDVDFSSSLPNQFLIRASNGVGIGTESPAAQLHVYSTAGDTAVFESWTGGNASHIHYGINGDWYIRSASNAGMVVLQDSGGNVGIGTSNPQSTLHVAGTLRVDTLASGGTTLCYNTGLFELATCTSSLRYKENVAGLSLGLETIAQLRPVTFDWKSTGEPDLGFVAEEVDQVTSLLTTRNAAGEIEGVKYDRISAVLVNAVQEQQAQIADLEAQVAALEQGTGGGGGTSPLATPWPWMALSIIALGGMGMVFLRRPGGGR